MTGDHGSSGLIAAAPNGPECRPSRLPIERISQASGRSQKAHHIGWNIVWLQYILRILSGCFTPPADFDVHFPIGARAVPGGDGQYHDWIQLRNVSDDKAVRPVPQAPEKARFGARPSVSL